MSSGTLQRGRSKMAGRSLLMAFVWTLLIPLSRTDVPCPASCSEISLLTKRMDSIVSKMEEMVYLQHTVRSLQRTQAFQTHQLQEMEVKFADKFQESTTAAPSSDRFQGDSPIPSMEDFYQLRQFFYQEKRDRRQFENQISESVSLLTGTCEVLQKNFTGVSESARRIENKLSDLEKKQLTLGKAMAKLKTMLDNVTDVALANQKRLDVMPAENSRNGKVEGSARREIESKSFGGQSSFRDHLEMVKRNTTAPKLPPGKILGMELTEGSELPTSFYLRFHGVLRSLKNLQTEQYNLRNDFQDIKEWSGKMKSTLASMSWKETEKRLASTELNIRNLQWYVSRSENILDQLRKDVQDRWNNNSLADMNSSIVYLQGEVNDIKKEMDSFKSGWKLQNEAERFRKSLLDRVQANQEISSSFPKNLLHPVKIFEHNVPSSGFGYDRFPKIKK